MGDHAQLYPFCRVTYWNGHTASAPEDAWNYCTVTPLGMYTYGEQTFPNTSEGTRDRDRLLSFLEHVYDLGRLHAKREIREVLGVKDPRS